MFNSIRRQVSLFVLVGALGANAAFAVPVKNKETKESTVSVIKLESDKDSAIPSKTIRNGATHSYRLNLPKGKTAVIYVSNNNVPASLRVVAPSGQVSSYRNDKNYRVVLSGEGEFTIEIGAAAPSTYSLKTNIQ